MPAKEGLHKKPEKYTQKCRKRQPERILTELADSRDAHSGLRTNDTREVLSQPLRRRKDPLLFEGSVHDRDNKKQIPFPN